MLKSIGLYFRKIDFLNFAVGAIISLANIPYRKGKINITRTEILSVLKICGSVKISAAITQLKYLFLHFCSNSPKIIPLKITSSIKDTKK